MTRRRIDAALARDVWKHIRDRDTRPHPARPDNRGALRITDEGGVAEVYLYDEIGFWGVMATDFVDQLIGIAASRIVLHLNSSGGDVFDGLAIHNALCDHPAQIEVRVDGLAASAASFIAMAGDSIAMNRGSQMMIHDASGFCVGNASDMAEMVALLDRCSDTIASLYASRAGGTVEAWRTAMRAETWYSAAEAVTAGLADSAVPEKGSDQATAAARFDLAMTTFHYAGRAQAPRPAMPAAAAEDEPAAAAGAEPPVDEIDQPAGDPVAPTDPEPEHEQPLDFDPAQFRDALRVAITTNTKEAAA